MQRVPCVAIIIQDLDGRVLLNLRDSNPGTTFANRWTLPGGRIEVNETAEQAARRELNEETGLELSLTFWKVYERPHPERDAVVEQHVFIGKKDHPSSIVLGEGQALEFFGKEKVFSLPMAFGFQRLLQEFFATGR